jgi:hypothetical protein
MHQRRRLKRLVRFFLGHFGSGQLPQFVVDQRQKLAGCLWIAALDSTKDLGDVAHSRECSQKVNTHMSIAAYECRSLSPPVPGLREVSSDRGSTTVGFSGRAAGQSEGTLPVRPRSRK